MDETVQKLIEIIRKEIGKVVIQKSDSKDSLSFTYDHDLKQYSAELVRRSPDGSEDKKQKAGLSMEEILPIITDSEFKEAISDFCQKRREKEANYAQAKQKLMEELSSMDIPAEQKETMEAIIDKVSQLPEYVGMKNRVPLTDKPDFKEHLRLADKTNWDNAGPLHLQLVQARIEESGTTIHNYPPMSLSQIVEYVSSKGIKMEKETSELSRED